MTTSTLNADRDSCTPAGRVTRSLLGYGLLAGPLYVTVSLAQALTREGFDLSRHAWSLLSNGDLGWLQITNFIVSGLMTVAFAVGLGRAYSTGPASTWGPRLIGGYGVSLIAAGLLRADPAQGFPVGAPTTGTMSWHGTGHFVAGAIGFTCLIAACFVVARRYARDGRAGWAAYSRATGVVFAAGFTGVAAGAGSPVSTLGFVAAVILAWAWICAAAVDTYRRLG